MYYKFRHYVAIITDMNDEVILPFCVQRENWTQRYCSYHPKFHKFTDTESRRLAPALIHHQQSSQHGLVLTFGCSLTGTSTRMATFRGFSLMISANRRSSVLARLPLLLVCSGRPPFCTRSSSTTRKNVRLRTTRKVHVDADKRNDLF
jgi:hypothetical protein